jgi:hypothetical protein
LWRADSALDELSSIETAAHKCEDFAMFEYMLGGLRYCALFDGTARAFDVERDKPFWQRKTTRSICRNGSG